MDRGWVQVTPSEFSWERDALAFLKQHLPDHEPYRAWANFEFVLDGSIGEVDVLVVSPKGVFLIEIKSWPGELRGHTRERSDDNPLLVTNRKAKRLKSLFARQPAFRGQHVPLNPTEPMLAVRCRGSRGWPLAGVPLSTVWHWLRCPLTPSGASSPSSEPKHLQCQPADPRPVLPAACVGRIGTVDRQLQTGRLHPELR